MNPIVSIVIVTFNSQDYIKNCLDSVLSITYKNKEVIVLDNNSLDKTKDILSNYKKKIKLIFMNSNQGYANGNNIAISESKAEYVFLLNPDTQVNKEFLQPLVIEMENDKKLAACQPIIFLLSQPKIINLTGKVTHLLGFDWIKDYKQKKIPDAHDIVSFSGSAVLLRRKYFEKVKRFDPEYFMYYEDGDLSWRFRIFGFKIRFVPSSVVFHDYKFIPKEDYQPLKKKLYFNERNRILTILKNYQIKTLLLLFPIILLTEIGMCFFSLIKGWYVEKIKSYISIINLLPYILEQRKFIQKNRVIVDKNITKDFEKEITFENYNNLFVNILLNPVVLIYWRIVRFLV